MGWSYHTARHYTRRGAIDRKKELDVSWTGKFTVLKSSMVGSTYYAAIKIEDTGEVFAAVYLTSSNMKDVFNFGYKPMDETLMPYEVNCPLSILGLLTPTDCQDANAWRNACRRNAEEKKSSSSAVLSKLPIGSKIIWTVPSDGFSFSKKGEKVELVKLRYPSRVRPLWVNLAGSYRISPKHLNMKDVEVVR